MNISPHIQSKYIYVIIALVFVLGIAIGMNVNTPIIHNPIPPSQEMPIYPGSENKPDTGDNMTQCTLEAMICPDGSAVGRTGPKCEFSPCPGN